MQSNIKILEIVSDAVNGQTISADNVRFIAQKLENKWGTLAFRRDICSLLLQQKDTAPYLANVDAVPKDELYSILAKNKQ